MLTAPLSAFSLRYDVQAHCLSDTLQSSDLNLQAMRARCHKLNMAATASHHDALECYIPLAGQESGDATTHFALLDKVNAFLASSQKVLFVIGEAGSGKSTFQCHLARTLAADYATQAPIVLLIPLDRYSTPSEGADWIEAYLLRQKLTLAEIETLRMQQRFIFLLEGLDKQSTAQCRQGLGQIFERWQAQYIISVRPEFIQQASEQLLPNQMPAQLWHTYWLAPFSMHMVKDYIKKYVEQMNPVGWDLSCYQDALDKWLNKAPLLKKEMRRPSSLRMALEILPSLSEQNTTQNAQRPAIPTNIVELCQAWLTLWFRRCEQNMEKLALTSTERTYLILRAQHDSYQHALSLTRVQVRQKQPQPIHTINAQRTSFSTAHTPYFPNLTHDIEQRLRPLYLPIHQQKESNGNDFIFPEIQAYLVASQIYESFQRNLAIYPEAILNWFSLVNEPLILDLLAQYATQVPLFKNHLYDWLYQSKANPRFQIGAANAITVLVRLGEIFTQLNLQNICIAGADLRYGIFDYVDLRGANLQRVQFTGAWLRHTQLEGAQLQGTQFEIPPKIAHLWKIPQRRPNTIYAHTQTIKSIAFSADGSLLATHADDHTLCLWKMPQGQLVQRLKLGCVPPQKPQKFDGYSSNQSCSPPQALHFSENGAWLVVQNRHKKAELYQTFQANQAENPLQQNAAQCIPSKQFVRSTVDIKNAQNIIFSPDGNQLIKQQNETLEICDLHTQKTKHHFYLPGLHRCLFSDTMQRLLAISIHANSVSIHDVEAQRLVRSFPLRRAARVKEAIYSPQGQWLAILDAQASATIWNVSSGKQAYSFDGTTHPLKHIVYSPDDKWFATTGQDHTLRIWKASSGTCIAEANLGHIVIHSIAWHIDANGIFLATGSDDSIARRWQLKTYGPSTCLLLQWASGQTQFMAKSAVLGKEHDLNHLDHALLKQHGAILQARSTLALSQTYELYQAHKTRTCRNFPLCAVM